MVIGPDQAAPFQTKPFPPTSPATQNEGDAHDTAWRALRVVSTATGALHTLPLNVIACPRLSTAAQNEAEGHETAVRLLPFGSGRVGGAQDVPLNVSTNPLVPTAAQNDADGQETAVGGAEALTVVGPDHPAAPSAADPNPSIAATTATSTTNFHCPRISHPPIRPPPILAGSGRSCHRTRVKFGG